MTGTDGTQVVIVDYFALAEPPALSTANGATLPPDLVARLAGPLAPGQYAQLAAEPEAAPIGRVVTAEGSVTATCADGTQVTLTTDSPVFQGDVLVTASGAAVGVVFNDDTTFSLGENARMVLDQLIYDPDTGIGESTFSVLQGVFVFVAGEIAGSQPDAMVVRTPVATIGIRGTTVAGRITIDGTDSTISLLTDADGSVGAIVITTISGEQLYLDRAFQAAVFDPLSLEATIVDLDPTQVDDLFGRVLRTHDVTLQFREAAAEETAVEDEITTAMAFAIGPEGLLGEVYVASLEDRTFFSLLAENVSITDTLLEVEDLRHEELSDDELADFATAAGGDEDDLSDDEIADFDTAAGGDDEEAIGFIDTTGGYDSGVDDGGDGPPPPPTDNGTGGEPIDDGGGGPASITEPSDDPIITTPPPPPPPSSPPTFSGFTGDPSELSGQIFGGGGFSGLDVTGAAFSGSKNPSASIFSSINFGSVGGTSFSLTDGILLTTGEGVPGSDPSEVLDRDIVSVDDDGLPVEQDSDLADLLDVLPSTIFDTTSLTFEINDVPEGVTSIVFIYMFGSDDAVNGDIAGIFVGDEFGDNFENKLLFPDDEAVRFDDPDTLANFFDTDLNNLSIAYDFLTAPTLVAVPVTEFTDLTIKIAIADLGDANLDSGLFITGFGLGMEGTSSTANADILSGDDGANTVDALAGDDIVFGFGGNDILTGGAGDDFIDGGGGLDTVVFSGSFEDYIIIGDNIAATVEDTVGDEGIDTLLNVERVTFLESELTIALDGSNAPPVLAASGTASFAEDGAATVIDGSVTITDNDSTNIEGATVSITGGTFVAGQDLLGFTDQNGITGSYNASTGVLTLTGNTSKADYQAALRSVTYENTSDNPLGATRTISFQVEDGSAATDDSNIATSTVQIITDNDAPAVTASATLAFTEGGGPGVIDATITISDIDSTNISGATVEISPATFVEGEDVLGFTDQNDISGSYNAETGVLTLSGEASLAEYETALRSVTYNNTSFTPDETARVIEFQVTDAGDGQDEDLEPSNVASSTVTVTAVDNVAPIKLSSVAGGTNGFKITGEATGDKAGFSVSSAGDLNGDGFDDVIVGAIGVDAVINGVGAAYVVFGASGGLTSVNLDTIAAGTGGFKIIGEGFNNDNAGWRVSGAGDVNGDGIDDLIVSSVFNGNSVGAAYVVFGATSGLTSLNLADVAAGTGGFKIIGENIGDQAGTSVSSAGDVNGDGIDDLLVGAWHNYAAGPTAGAAYVVFGDTSVTTAVNLDDVANGTGGFRIIGEASNDYAGFSVSSAGDVNGDGVDDVIVGAFGEDTGGNRAGAAYVVYGATGGFSSVNLVDVAGGTGGFKITGETAFDRAGWSVSSAGDVNGDGFDDLFIGASATTRTRLMWFSVPQAELPWSISTTSRLAPAGSRSPVRPMMTLLENRCRGRGTSMVTASTT